MDRIIVKLRGAWDEGRVSAIIQACGVSDTGRRIPQIKRFLVRAADADAALVVLRAHPDVEHAARDALLAPAAYHVASNDPLLDSSWHMKRIGAFHAWKFTKGAGAVVAVADSGVVPHEDLPVPNVGVTGWNCLDPLGYTGGNTADVLDRYTYDEVGDTNFSHGTMCGSFVYGLHNNGLGVSGLAPEVTAKMYVCFAMPGVFLAEGADAIVRAADDGADAVSCSWGAGSDGLAGSEQIMADAVAYAHAAGTSVVVAAMNHGYNHETWTAVMIPAETPGVICVGATTDTSDRRATFSNYGSVVDIVAPGEWLPVPDISPTGGTGPFTYYKTAKGTSFSTPLVAAALGLIKSINPNLTRTQREAILLGAGADRIRDDYAEGDWPNAVALNAAKCALAALATVPANAGVVYPYIQFWGAGASTVVSGGVATTTLDGSVLFEARGYSSDPVTSVEVYVGSTLVYSGAPATLQATASNAGGAQAVRVVAYTATGQGEDTYTDIVVASLSNVTAYEHPGDVAFIGEKLPGVGNTYEPIGAGTVLATRVTVARRATLREFRVAWKTDAASMSFRVGIYTVGGDGKPANLVGQSVDYSGPVSDVSSTGSPVAVALAAPITLEPGDYFFAIHGGAAAWVDVNYGRAGATALYRRQYAQAYGSGLPAPFGAALVETPASGSSTSDVKVFATYDQAPNINGPSITNTAFSLQVAAADAFRLVRGGMAGLSYLAGPRQWEPWPHGWHAPAIRLGVTTTPAFDAAWARAVALAHSLGFDSFSAFAAAWANARNEAIALGFSADNTYFVPTTASGAAAAHLFGFGSVAAFAAAWQKTQTTITRLGFASMAQFFAVWEQNVAVDLRLGHAFAHEYYPPGHVLGVPMGVIFDIHFRSAFAPVTLPRRPLDPWAEKEIWLRRTPKAGHWPI